MIINHNNDVLLLMSRVFCECTTVIMMDAFRDSLRNALYYIFYQNFSRFRFFFYSFLKHFPSYLEFLLQIIHHSSLIHHN